MTTIHPPLEMLKMFCDYEMSLQNPGVRSNQAQLQKLLHDEFMEIDRSGQYHGKARTIETLLSAQEHPLILAQDFELIMPAYSVAQLVYRSAHMQDTGLAHFTWRSSLWQLTPVGWQMRFHQMTPCQAFAQNKTYALKQEALQS
jgi:hypothetical protein